MAQVSGLSIKILSSPQPSLKRTTLFGGVLIGGGVAALGVWLSERSIALIPTGALLGAALASSLLYRKNLVQREARDSICELVRGWGVTTHEKDLDLCLKKYKSLNLLIPADVEDKRSFAYNQLFQRRQLPPRDCSHHSIECSYIAEKLGPTYDPTEDDNPWDTLLASVDSTGTIQAVALYSEEKNKLVNLVTHPHNIPLPEGEEPIGVPTRGAGSSIMHYLLDKSRKSNRPLTLEPTESSIPFFKKFGLELQPRALGGPPQEMKISPDQIRLASVKSTS